MADLVEVNRLLEASRSAHLAYRRAANPAPGEGQPNYPLAEQHVAKAHDLRLQAHHLDPEHQASGWSEDKVPHAKIIAFYERYVTLA